MARRLAKERTKFESAPLDFATASPVGDDVMKWTAMIMGPEESPYEGGVFQVELNFPAEYPFKPPQVKFITKIYHPNVKKDTGEICNDLLSEDWGPTLDIKYVLTTLRGMLASPNAGNPLEPEIGRQYSENKSAFESSAREWTRKYATSD